MNEEVLHGTNWAYQRGCRCIECRAENNRRTRERRDKWRAQRAAQRSMRDHDERGLCRWCA